jgi:hypothetical protein
VRSILTRAAAALDADPNVTHKLYTSTRGSRPTRWSDEANRSHSSII